MYHTYATFRQWIRRWFRRIQIDVRWGIYQNYGQNNTIMIQLSYCMNLTADVFSFTKRETSLNLHEPIPHASNLTHWGRVTHICVDNLTIIGPDNVLSPGRRQTVIWTNAGILVIGPRGTNFSKILIGIQTSSFKKMHLKISSTKWFPLCLDLNVLSSASHVCSGDTAPTISTKTKNCNLDTWISSYMLSIVWDETTYPFLNFNGCTVEV